MIRAGSRGEGGVLQGRGACCEYIAALQLEVTRGSLRSRWNRARRDTSWEEAARSMPSCLQWLLGRCVWMRVCVHACVSVNAHTHARTHAHMHTCTHARNAHTTTQTVHACTRPRTIHRLWFSRGVPLLGCVSRHVVLAQLHTSESLLAPSEFIYFHPKTEHQPTDVHCCLQGRSGHPLLTVVQTTLSHPLPPP